MYRAHFVRDEVSRLITNDAKIKTVVNFGCSYGWLESELARRFSNVAMWGIDRSPYPIQRNEEIFGSDNCHYVASDIFDFIENNPGKIKDSIFTHVNIGTYFLPGFLEKLYKAIWSAGGRYIVLYEPCGLSRQLNKYYEFSYEPRDSVVFRGVMIIHNYPNLLDRAGFQVINSNMLKPPHPHKDFRSVTFTSKRRD